MPAWTLTILATWMIWALAWIAAWRHANRTLTRATRGAELPYRIINILGFVSLFATLPDATDRTPWPFVPLWRVPPPIGWSLAALAIAALALALSARLTLGRLWSAAVTRKQAHRIVEEGPYALVRHPIYTAIICAAAALALARGTPVSLAGFALLAIGYVIKARVEERFLAAELGPATYAAYRRKVPMLVPFTRRLLPPRPRSLASSPKR